jgi:cytidyltransferase-like protein
VRTVVYPGTFDPITNGHSDLIQRASSLFGRVVVAVADDTGKAPAFATAQRMDLVNQVIGHLPNVAVESFSGLLVTYLLVPRARDRSLGRGCLGLCIPSGEGCITGAIWLTFGPVRAEAYLQELRQWHC